MTTFLQHLGLRSKCHNAPFMMLYGWHDSGKDDTRVCSDLSHFPVASTTSTITKKDIEGLVDAIVKGLPYVQPIRT